MKPSQALFNISSPSIRCTPGQDVTSAPAVVFSPSAAGGGSFNSSSCGGVESRHAGLDGQVDEAVNIAAPERVRRWQQPLREQVRQAPPNWPRSRSPGPTNGGSDAYALPSAGVAPGPQEASFKHTVPTLPQNSTRFRVAASSVIQVPSSSSISHPQQ